VLLFELVQTTDGADLAAAAAPGRRRPGRSGGFQRWRRGRRGRRRGGGGDREGAWRGVREIVLIRSAAVSPTGVEPRPGSLLAAGVDRITPLHPFAPRLHPNLHRE